MTWPANQPATSPTTNQAINPPGSRFILASLLDDTFAAASTAIRQDLGHAPGIFREPTRLAWTIDLEQTTLDDETNRAAPKQVTGAAMVGHRAGRRGRAAGTHSTPLTTTPSLRGGGYWHEVQGCAGGYQWFALD